MRYDPVLENALHEYRIPYPQNRASSNGFIRWGKNQRYWAIPVDDGYFFGDFASDLSTAVFPGKEVGDFDRTRYSKRVQDLIEQMEAESASHKSNCVVENCALSVKCRSNKPA